MRLAPVGGVPSASPAASWGTFLWTLFPFHDGRRQSNLLVALFIGRCAAGVLPELFVRNRPGTDVRAAALEPSRSVRRYVTPTAARWLAGSGALHLAALLVRQTVTLRVAPTRADAAMLLSASVLLAIISTAAVRRIAKRPEPAGGPHDLAESTRRSAASPPPERSADGAHSSTSSPAIWHPRACSRTPSSSTPPSPSPRSWASSPHGHGSLPDSSAILSVRTPSHDHRHRPGLRGPAVRAVPTTTDNNDPGRHPACPSSVALRQTARQRSRPGQRHRCTHLPRA